jgi:hypothetical protein
VRTTGTRVGLATGAAVLALPALMSPAQAEVLDRGTEQFVSDPNDPQIQDCGDFTLLDEYNVSLHYILMGPRGNTPAPDPDPWAYEIQNLDGKYTFTNQATGHWFTIEAKYRVADAKIVALGNHQYQVQIMSTGTPDAVRDMAGKLITSDRGRLVVSFVLDTLGDADASNDVEGPPTYIINGPHPNSFLSPCDLAKQYNLA